MFESPIVTHILWESTTETVSENKSRTSRRSRWGHIKWQGHGIEWHQKAICFSYHTSWISTRNIHLSSASVICVTFDLIGWSYLSLTIHMVRYWFVRLPVPRWHRSLDEPTPRLASFLEIDVHQKCPEPFPIILSDRLKYLLATCDMKSDPSGQLFWGFKPLFFAYFFDFPGFPREQ
jgi:hypothetical protein